MARREHDEALDTDERDRLGELVARLGGPRLAAPRLGLGEATIARALTGLPVQRCTTTALRLHLERADEGVRP